jgi:predicted deacetylase
VARERWLEALRAALDLSPCTFWFRDDDAGWANDRLFALVDLFAHYDVPLDVAVIPAALDAPLAAQLLRRGGSIAFHQHGFAHANHEPSGRRCEFGPARSADDQRRDLAAGAERLAELLGPTEPIFTPPWNRCIGTTGLCLLELGFRALARDATAPPLHLAGLQELQVHVDWARPDRRERLAEASNGAVGVMLHHELIGATELEGIERLLALVASHPQARCVPMRSLLEAASGP